MFVLVIPIVALDLPSAFFLHLCSVDLPNYSVDQEPLHGLLVSLEMQEGEQLFERYGGSSSTCVVLLDLPLPNIVVLDLPAATSLVVTCFLIAFCNGVLLDPPAHSGY